MAPSVSDDRLNRGVLSCSGNVRGDRPADLFLVDARDLGFGNPNRSLDRPLNCDFPPKQPRFGTA